MEFCLRKEQIAGLFQKDRGTYLSQKLKEMMSDKKTRLVIDLAEIQKMGEHELVRNEVARCPDTESPRSGSTLWPGISRTTRDGEKRYNDQVWIMGVTCALILLQYSVAYYYGAP